MFISRGEFRRRIKISETEEAPKRVVTGAVTIMGAPVSWVTIFGAILGASTIIPVVIFIGGETAPLSIALAPCVGLILGPWGGLAAGLIGGTIGMFLNPTAYWAGPLNIFEVPMIAFVAGLMANRKWIWVSLFCILTIALWSFIPWFYPGPPDYPIGADPLMLFLTPWWVYAGLIFTVLLVGLYPLIPNWLNSKNPAKIAPALLLTTWVAREIPHFLLWIPFNLWYFYPANLNIVVSFLAMPTQVPFIYGAATILGTGIIYGLTRTKLKKIPGAVW